MKVIFLFLICLSSVLSIKDSHLAPLKKELVPLRKHTNKSFIVGIDKFAGASANDLLQVFRKNKEDTSYLLSVFANVDPTKLDEVIVLVRALLKASEDELAAITLSRDTANTAYTDATAVYDAAVLAKVNLEGEKSVLETNLAAKTAELDQQVTVVADALTAQTEALGAKTNAQSTLDIETTRLNSEITTLNQVITLLESLIGSTSSGKFVDGIHGTNNCPAGSSYITTEVDCVAAAVNCLAGVDDGDCSTWIYHMSGSWAYNPKGCFYDGGNNGGSDVFWNTHATGGHNQVGDRPICKLD